MRYQHYALFALLSLSLFALSGQAQQLTPIRTLDEALALAHKKSPSLRQSKERALKTRQTIAQILAGRKPQASVRASYTRLLNGGSGFGGGGAGGGGAVQNPFPVLLQTTPPGAQPVQLPVATRAEATPTPAPSSGGFGSGTDLNQQSVSLSISRT